ncbi:uncharacterized protein LOC117048455 isoform X1 [Lacerta agilis]|uniref:uncharacterized protein LOC117048455 isoform X1 n=2 Tax=Lacerta agilis TaxID=80427 RepID=UPI001419D67C|nr:uncharacterized protein LOC117048455 isoform X1 [Lacerta agilis]XP_033008169.1 uncharacterized protein LOC117048455 isoform X1 [Lacerta agilis]XP_033008170.1 uncharacterized protein LOC117048455 isoform X1 [Lacerta agilis]
MDWDTQLSSLLTAADSNMAKIKQRLNTASISSKADLLLDRINTESAVLTEPQTGPSPLHFTCGAHSCCRMAAEELSAISKQLHSQAQVIESLTQAVHRLKQEKELQQQSISHLEEEVDRLQHSSHSGLDSVLGVRMEGLKTEFRSLRQQVFQQSDGDCTPDPFSNPGIMQDMRESKKILWQEYKCIRREMEHLKHKLDQQEDDLFHQVSATDEIKKTQRRYCQMLEDLTDSHKAQSKDLDKARNETQSTQKELSHVKTTVTDLKEQVKGLHLEDEFYAHPLRDKNPHLRKKRVLLHDATLSSLLSDDSASEFSLTDVSSDELFSEPEIAQLADDKISIPGLKLEKNTPGGAAGGTLDAEDLSSELTDTPPELNSSDL